MNSDSNHRMRILHLPVNTINQAMLYSRGLRALGHQSDHLLYDLLEEDTFIHDGHDINLKLTSMGYLKRARTIYAALRECSEKYDIFHFHCGRTFIPLMAFSRWSVLPPRIGRHFQFLDFLDLSYLRRKGKKIVFHFWGCDIRDPEFDLTYPYSACRVCPPEIKALQCDIGLKKKINHITLKYGDARLSSGDLNIGYPDFQWVENAIDTDFWKPLSEHEIPDSFRWKKNGAVRVYHSFARSDLRNDVKGTKEILQAVEELRREGHRIEVMFFNSVPHQELRYYQMQADIVVDQLKCGHYGNTGVECLSMGKPVVCHLREDVEALMHKNHPIIKADTQNIKEVLRRLVEDIPYREEMGGRSREFAVAHHDYRVVAERLEEIYRSMMCAQTQN